MTRVKRKAQRKQNMTEKGEDKKTANGTKKERGQQKKQRMNQSDKGKSARKRDSEWKPREITTTAKKRAEEKATGQ